jgi:Saccharopine dehydrogenase NADP binding domain
LRRVLVLGGYGAFGQLVAERLARVAGIEVMVAGRDRAKAAACATELGGRALANVVPAGLDGAKISAADLQELRPAVLINATGPYQDQDYRLAPACIGAGVHYLDLADASGFVLGIGALDAEAKAAGVLVVSGASTVPALSAAVADALAPRFAQLDAITTIISPGNRFDPGIATTRSILGTLGRPIAGGAGVSQGDTVRGWQGLRRVRLPGLGPRWVGHCDAPDRALFPQRYPGLRRADVFAALEVGLFHLGLWGVSWLVRAGLVRQPQRLAGPLLALKHRLGFLGSDRGGMLVQLDGLDHAGQRKRIDWHLVAGSGHGPYIPATASVLLAKRLLDDSLRARGAMACMGLFTLDDFMAEIADLDIEAGTA